jgi:hypothetical protein
VQQHHQPFKGKRAVIHKNTAIRGSGAYICKTTNLAIRKEGIASAKDDPGARDRQWWRHVCTGACGFVAQVQQGTGWTATSTTLSAAVQAQSNESPLATTTLSNMVQTHAADASPLATTTLSNMVQTHGNEAPLATAPCAVGLNGVRRGQWVVTLYAPHTCEAAPAALAATPATPAAATAAAPGTQAAAAAALPAASAIPPAAAAIAPPDAAATAPAAAASAAPHAAAATAHPAAAAIAPPAAASAADDSSEGEGVAEGEVPPAQPADTRQRLTEQGQHEPDAARLPVGAVGAGAQSLRAEAAAAPPAQPASCSTSGGGDRPLLHAGAVFESLEEFRRAVVQGQEHESMAAVHKKRGIRTNGAYICRETQKAILKEETASGTCGTGAKDRQWWRHVCAGACGFVAQVQQARAQSRSTTLSDMVLTHVNENENSLAAAPCEVGVNGVRQGQWVVTLYAPHTCVPAGSPSVAFPATPAAIVDAASTVAAAPVAATGDRAALPAAAHGPQKARIAAGAAAAPATPASSVAPAPDAAAAAPIIATSDRAALPAAAHGTRVARIAAGAAVAPAISASSVAPAPVAVAAAPIIATSDRAALTAAAHGPPKARIVAGAAAAPASAAAPAPDAVAIAPAAASSDRAALTAAAHGTRVARIGAGAAVAPATPAFAAAPAPDACRGVVVEAASAEPQSHDTHLPPLLMTMGREGDNDDALRRSKRRPAGSDDAAARAAGHDGPRRLKRKHAPNAAPVSASLEPVPP